MITDESKKARMRRRMSMMELTRKRLLGAPGSLFMATDISGATPTAASRALARLAQQGVIERVRHGVYYVPKETLVGKSRPSQPAVLRKVLAHRARPTGITAANILGMTTQVAAEPEFATYTTAPPQGLHSARLTLRPRGQTGKLDLMDAAFLEFLRERGRSGELSPEDTLARAHAILLGGSPAQKPAARLRKLRDAALAEPPRVRAILGALMQSAGLPESLWRPLHDSLNGLSRFDFGLFSRLPNAKEWQAR